MLDVGAMVGEYRIEGLVGEGGMGQVYGAVHPVIGKRAAIKVLRRDLCSSFEAIERFVLEARAVNQIGHPNIVDVFAFGALPDGRQYMVMEWLRGESLSARLVRLPPALDEACEILLGICAALDAAHAANIVHRDLKPHNVFMVEVRAQQPMVKLLDFGLVKLMGSDDVRMERTRSGSLLGTPAYMSPEQARGRGVDLRTDLYALGVIAFEMMAGRLPFVEESAMEMVVAHLQQPPPAPSSVRPDLPPEADALILRLLDKDPANRPPLPAVVDALRGIQRDVREGRGRRLLTTPPVAPVSAAMRVAITAPVGISTIGLANGEHRVTTSSIETPRGRRRWLAVAGAAAIVVGVLTFVAVNGTRGKSPAAAAGGAASIDAAPAIVVPPSPPPPPPEPIAAPAPVDAAVAAPPPTETVETGSSRSGRRRKRSTEKPPVSPPPTGPDPTPPPSTPPPDDGDGVIPVIRR
jgi:serine/threonine-protein kinase